MKQMLCMLSFAVGILSSCSSNLTHSEFFTPVNENTLRAPAYPLVTIDPYTSGWSMSDQLNADQVRHWTGKAFPLLGVIRIDGKCYRFMGEEKTPLQSLLPTAALEKWEAAYTYSQPKGDWTQIQFDDSSWKQGKAAFGTPEMQHLSTTWQTPDIWVRRSFEVTDDWNGKELFLNYSHDDVFELYVNGKEIVNTGHTWKNDVMLELNDEVKALLKPGKNVIAAHCHNSEGGAYVDFGLSEKMPDATFFTEAAQQKSAVVMPTQTYYTFECGGVQLDVVFTAPLLIDDLDKMTRPINYLSYQVKPLDGSAHDVQIYLEATSSWATNVPGQEVSSMIDQTSNGVMYAKTGTTAQPILGTRGDDVRIDWGYFYLASATQPNSSIGIGDFKDMKKAFSEQGFFSTEKTMAPSNSEQSLGYVDNLGKVSSPASGFAMIGYDDIYAIQYYGDNRMAYWKHDSKVDMNQALDQAASDYVTTLGRCRDLDKKLMKDAYDAGGQQYAELCALAYRQAIAAHKLVEDKEGNLLFFSKENFSNGSIGTVDVTYPSAPLFLVYNPDLLKGMLNFIFGYSESGKWTKPFAAHDLGTYPLANGQTYGGDMPVEESGNMLILTTAIAMREGNADYAKKHWKVLTTWADYLIKEGLDPENQLCTDDFAGHFAHNANLSIKAILGIAGYGKMAEMLGDKETAEKYLATAREMASKWKEIAADGDHYKLTFDKPGTWSQKYNLVWDKVLDLGIFDESIAQTEMAYYKTVQNTYGLPLDSRKTYTKSDWIVWTATMADNSNDFNALIVPLYKYVNETTTRIPLSDWHETTDGKSVGFRARSVVGGYYMKVLEQLMSQDK